MEGLSDTILSSILEVEALARQEELEDSEGSILDPGPFHAVPLVDLELTLDSSYEPSRRRDVALSCDTFTSSGDTTATPEGYREEKRRQQIDRMDILLQNIVRLNRESTQAAESSLASTNMMTTSSLMTTAGLKVSTGSSIASSERQGSYTTDSSFAQKLRFPLCHIMDTDQESYQLVMQRSEEKVV